MPQLNLKPTHKIVTNFYKAVAESGQLSLLHEGAVAPHFAALLRACAAPLGWTLQEQYPLPRKGQHPIRLDGALLDPFSLRHGVWEAKDRDDDLQYIVRLIGQVVAVSVETVAIVAGLPELEILEV